MQHYFVKRPNKPITVAIACCAFWLLASCATAPIAKVEPPAADALPPVAGNTLVVAGDIADCRSAAAPDSAAEATAKLVEAIPGLVLTLGDNTYPVGAASEFNDCYTPTWGRFKQRTRPSPGNHDYLTLNADPYYDYFAEIAGPARRGYYSFDYAGWHIISLNSNIDAENDSAQMQWLRQDIAASKARCTLAYWHHPVFTSGKRGNNGKMKDVWKALHDAGADVVLSGHDHHYERFAPQNIGGNPDARGLREFLIGTGGVGITPVGTVQTNSEVRNEKDHGVVKFTLRDNDYDWEFIPVAGDTFRDSGSDSCH
jgi:acid phosphatase type 7